MTRTKSMAAALATTSLLALSGAGAAIAQTAVPTQTAPAVEPQQSPPSSDDDKIGEIVVTAQRRGENLQNVPISVNAITNTEALAKGITDTRDLASKVPTLTISYSGPQLLFLRGVGTSGANINQDQSVATYLDGVYLYSSWASTVPVSNIERTEVLKGPQGTLFGRNTTGGVIQLITRDPLAPSTVEGRFGYGNYDTKTGQFYTSVRNDAATFGLSVAADVRQQDNGFGFRSVDGRDAYYNNYQSVQIKVAAKPTDTTKITGMFWVNHNRSSGVETQVLPGVVGIDGVVSNPRHFESRADSPNIQLSTSYFGYGRLDQELGFANFVSITSYRHVASILNLDQDSTPLKIVDARLNQPSSAFSQEIQLVSRDDSKFKWIVGAFYFDASAGYKPLAVYGAGAAPFPEVEFFAKQKTKSLAGFAQVTVPLGDRTNVTGGFRYTDEHERSVDHRFGSLGTVFIAVPNSKISSSGPTWRASVDHRFSPEVLAYASYNRGLKSGGFDLNQPAEPTAYRPEKLDAFEVGVKTDLLDHRVRLNVAGFYYFFKNIQVQHIENATTFTTNAARAELRGIDADLTAKIVRHLTLSFTGGYLDGIYKKFPGAVGYPASPYDGPTFTFDASGQRTVYSPKVSGSVGLTYELPTSVGDFTLNGLAQYTARQFVGADNTLDIPHHAEINSSLNWVSTGGHINAGVWVKNLTNHYYYINALEETLGYLVYPGEPRTFGGQVGFKF